MVRRQSHGCPQCHEVEAAALLSRRSLVGGSAAALAAHALARSGLAQTPAASPSVSGPTVMPPNYKGAQITKVTPLSEQKATLRVFVAGRADVPSYEDNEFTRWLEEMTNVHIEWQVASSVDTNAALSTTLASGDYPDVLMGFGLNGTRQLVYATNGILQPIEEFIDQHATRAQQIFAMYPDSRGTLTLPDGHIYSMPNANDCYHCRNADRAWIYKPWLDGLGLEMPQTLDDLTRVLIAFRDNDPNGNGLADEVAVMGSAESGGDASAALRNFVFNSFFYRGIDDLRVASDGVTLEETLTDPQRREAFRYLNSLVQEGIITPEHFSYTNEQLRALANAEDVRLGLATAYYWGSFVDMTDFGLDARWRNYVALPTLTGPGGVRNSQWNYYGAVYNGDFCVTTACPDPALAIRWCDTFYDLVVTLRSVHGILGEDVVWASEGEIGINGEQALWKQLISWSEIDGSHYWSQANPSFRSSEFRLGEAVDEAQPTFEKALYESTRDAWFPYAQDQGLQPMPYALEEAQANERTVIRTSFDNYLEQIQAQFILGTVDLDAGWDAYVEQLNQMGLPRYVEISNAAYSAALEAAGRRSGRS